MQREKKKKAWLVQRILSRWHFHSIGATVALTEGNLQEINLKAEGEPETYLQRITPKLFVCFPWDRKWKAAKQMAVTPPLTPDFGGKGLLFCQDFKSICNCCSSFFEKLQWKLPFLMKNVKTLSVFHISLLKKSSIFQQIQHFSYFWILGSTTVWSKYSMIWNLPLDVHH